MKTIEPISIWYNGKTNIAAIFSLICISDNLKDNAIFYYKLLDANFILLAQDNLTMSLPDYATDWATNESAYNWAATQLGLTITGEYVPPVPPVPEIIDPVTE
jgi:hypothetical protein